MDRFYGKRATRSIPKDTVLEWTDVE